MKNYFITILVIGLFSIFSIAVLAQSKTNRRTTTAPVRPVKNMPPTTNGVVYQKIVGCHQLTGDDLLFKNRQCKLANGQITTVGVYCEDYSSICQQKSKGNSKAGSEEIMARPNNQNRRNKPKPKRVP